MTQAATTRTVFLTGYMGAGKTTIGRLLAQRMGWGFFDLDDHISLRTGMSPSEIFATRGESGFRTEETAALQELLVDAVATTHRIIALGGGTLTVPMNLELTREPHSLTICLDAPVEVLYQRCASQNLNRPLLGTSSEFHDRYQQRNATYQLTPYRVDTNGKPPDIVVEEIIQILDSKSTEAL